MTLETIRTIAESLREFVKSLGNAAGTFHHDIEILIDELSKTVRSLEDVRGRLQSLTRSEAEFGESFETAYTYIRDFYTGRQNLSKARTHCSDVRRSVRRIRFKFTKVMTADVGLDEWNRVETAIRVITEDDEKFKKLYLSAIEYVFAKLSSVARAVERNPKKAWKLYCKTIKAFERRLDGLNETLDAIAEAQLVLRDHVGM
jgi:DNA repair ATPase RecN